jgi:hypothetical protein
MIAFSELSCARWGLLILGDKDVKKFNSLPLYWLGDRLGTLDRVMEFRDGHGPTVRSSLQSILLARNDLEIFTNTTYGFLPLSKEAAKSAILKINEILGDHEPSPTKKPGEPDVFTKSEIMHLHWAMHDFNSVLSTELPQENIYYATPKLAYDMDALINSGERALPEDVLASLGDSKDRVIEDIRESARCLAFGIATAVGFHIYRAIECIVVEEYFPLLGIDLPDNRNLGKYIKLLKDKGVDNKITEMLTHIKDEYRNPISHPEDFWDNNKAGSAFGVAMSIITMMLHDIEGRRLAGSP